MKTSSRLWLGWGAAVGLATTLGCGTVKGITGGSGETTVALAVGSQLPAADAKVTVEPKGNYQKLTINANHLAEPSAVKPGATVYVVWLEPGAGEGPLQNLGPLTVNEKKEGRLEATTPYRAFRIFVTAENAPNVTEPSQQLMTASVRPTGVTY
jgi:hypothetical protein